MKHYKGSIAKSIASFVAFQSTILCHLICIQLLGWFGKLWISSTTRKFQIVKRKSIGFQHQISIRPLTAYAYLDDFSVCADV